MPRLALLLSLLLLAGCAAKRHRGPRVDLIVPISCIKRPVLLKGCDPETYRDCDKAMIEYYKACAMVELKRQ